MSELQVMWWIQRLRGKVARTSTPPSYGLLGRKLTYGVDYGNYMHQLAAEFGGAPSLRTLALQHGQRATLGSAPARRPAPPQRAPGGSKAARRSQSEAQPLGAQPPQQGRGSSELPPRLHCL